mmetsp:Transcript_39364/g.91270  ORF Transcript_39364/g.91270 Transcript_39364/m.91270 type:complete len:365 (-) Transcript_39364:1373-2467(-)
MEWVEVVAETAREEHRILRHKPNGAAQSSEPKAADVNIVEEDPATSGFQDPQKSQEKAGLAATSGSGDGHFCPLLKRQADALQHVTRDVRIACLQVLYLNMGALQKPPATYLQRQLCARGCFRPSSRVAGLTTDFACHSLRVPDVIIHSHDAVPALCPAKRRAGRAHIQKTWDGASAAGRVGNSQNRASEIVAQEGRAASGHLNSPIDFGEREVRTQALAWDADSEVVEPAISSFDPGFLLWDREVFVQPGKRNELKLGASGCVQIGINGGFKQQQVRETDAQGAGTNVCRAHQSDHVHGGRVEAPHEHNPIHQPSPQHSISRQSRLQLVVNCITHLQCGTLLVSIRTDDNFVADHVRDKTADI